jgi:hypothetical protein
LREADQLDTPLDHNATLLDGVAQDLLGLRLRYKQQIMVAAINLCEVEAEHTLAAAINATSEAGVAEPD